MSAMLHITETRRDLRFDEWVAYCRCGWTGSYLSTQTDARRDGDAHLRVANRPRLDENGTAYLGFYDAGTGLAFTWDGVADYIEVAQGGMGEPVTATIPAPDFNAGFEPVLHRFRAACLAHAEYVEP